jgi:NAD(P)-dependent dehydrogenase (short-subunit alcohol dehydrogenase family)
VLTESLLDGKTALVTGPASTRGLGYAMVTALLGAGARVALVDVARDRLEQTAQLLSAQYGDTSVVSVSADLSDPVQATSAVDEVVRRFGHLDVLVNNAGVDVEVIGLCSRSTPFWEISAEAWQEVTEVNYLAQVYTAAAAARHMIPRKKGMIIGVTTSLDTMWRAKNTSYGAAKAAHEAFVTSASLTLAGTGVCANVLIPGGTTNTDLVSKERTEDPATYLQPDIMQAPVVWLASDEALNVTGCRFIAALWDSELPIDDRLRTAGAASAWKVLGRRSVWELSSQP